MTISSSKLPEALRAAIPFGTAVAEYPYRVDHADAITVAGTASVVLASDDVEPRNSTTEDIRR